MKANLKENWIPRWQRNWNRFKRDKQGAIERPTPRLNPLETNHERALRYRRIPAK